MAAEQDFQRDLRSRIKDIGEKMSFLKVEDSARQQRDAAGSIGAESPLTVLYDIRESQGRLLECMKELLLSQEQKREDDKRMHEELCTLMMGMSQPRLSSIAESSLSAAPIPTSMHGGYGQKYYYGSNEIQNGTKLASCILMHLDSMLILHPQFSKIKGADNTFMDLKDWYVLCDGALNADKVSKQGLRLPKNSDEDFKQACSVVASTAYSRRPPCDVSHLAVLLERCPELMNTVEWLRSSLVRCTGILSPERSCRLSLVSHPFLDQGGELNVQKAKTLRLQSKAIREEVMLLKVTQKKKYMHLILQVGMGSVDALSKVKQEASK